MAQKEKKKKKRTDFDEAIAKTGINNSTSFETNFDQDLFDFIDP